MYIENSFTSIEEELKFISLFLQSNLIRFARKSVLIMVSYT